MHTLYPWMMVPVLLFDSHHAGLMSPLCYDRQHHGLAIMLLCMSHDVRLVFADSRLKRKATEAADEELSGPRASIRRMETALKGVSQVKTYKSVAQCPQRSLYQTVKLGQLPQGGLVAAHMADCKCTFVPCMHMVI